MDGGICLMYVWHLHTSTVKGADLNVFVFIPDLLCLKM
jgi:hypothetical protein